MQFTESLVLSPNEGTRRSLKSGLLLFVLGLLAWLLFGLLLGQFIGLPPGLLFGLVTGLLFGLVAGLLFGLQAVLQHYTLRIFLARSGVFPWKAVPFLEDATARILLRRVGGGYSFTHRMLLDHFADMETKTAPDAKTLPAATVKDV